MDGIFSGREGSEKNTRGAGKNNPAPIGSLIGDMESGAFAPPGLNSATGLRNPDLTQPQEPVDTFSTGAVRGSNSSHAAYHLVSPIAIRRLAQVHALGSRKYPDHNWTLGIPVSNLINHALTHIFEFLFGVNHDEDHLAHAFWNLATAMHMEETRPDMLADLPPYSERMIEYKPVAPESAEWDRQQAAKKEASSVTVTSPSPEPAPSPSWPPFTEKFGKTPPIFDTASLRKKLRNFLANADDKYSNETAPEDSVEFDGDFSKLPMPMTIGEYQEQINAWSKKNFPDNWSESGKHRPLLGMGEEAGEIGEALMDMMLQLGVKVGRLNHAFLKTQQGIRGSAEEHLNKIIDGVADLFIFMCNFCGVINVNLEQSIYDTWEEVRKRDWTKNKNTGK